MKRIFPGDKETYRWKYVIKDEKLGNSIFLFYEMGWDEAMKLLKRGTINVLLLEKEGNAEYHFDPMNPDAQLTYLKLRSIIGGGEVKTVLSNGEIKPLTVTGTRYIDFLVPGLITMGVMMSSMWGISYGIIEKRSKKLLRRLVATPMKKSHFLIALITVRITMNFIESLVLFLLCSFCIQNDNTGRYHRSDTDVSCREYCFCRDCSVRIIKYIKYGSGKRVDQFRCVSDDGSFRYFFQLPEFSGLEYPGYQETSSYNAHRWHQKHFQ